MGQYLQNVHFYCLILFHLRTVTINGGDGKLQLPTNDNNNLAVDLLKQYFPGAIGLTYIVGKEKRAVQKEQDYFKAPFETGWGTFEYSVFFGNTSSSNGEFFFC